MFAGSNLGERPEFKEQAIALGKMFVENDYELVYGGSCVGLMGEVANEVLRLGGRVTGVMPRGLFRGEIVHTGLTELIEVETMHERKAKMAELADAFIALSDVYEVAVVGRQHVKWGETPIAFIVKKSNSVLTEKEVIEHCRLFLAKYKIPKEIIFLKELPKNATGKIQKAQLANPFLLLFYYMTPFDPCCTSSSLHLL
ncbi:AMP-binding enzyme, partial [Bacillus sp. B-TM1]